VADLHGVEPFSDLHKNSCTEVCLWNFSLPDRGSILLLPREHFRVVDICLSWRLNFQGSSRGGCQHDLQYALWADHVWMRNSRKMLLVVLLASTHLHLSYQKSSY